MFRTLILCSLAAAPAGAQEVERLVEVLRIGETVEIMREEGIEYGISVAEDLFPGRAPQGWERVVREIYSDEMGAAVEASLTEALDDVEVAPLVDFFASERGQEIVALELEARRAMGEEAVEEAAIARARELRDTEAPLVARVDAFVAANDLVQQNVVGAMNANYAFAQGLADGGGLDGVSEDQITADIWAQEPEIRAETEAWLDGYLMLAYQPLAPEDLEAYIAISETESGAALNQAVFDAFDEMYVNISRQLGTRAAVYMSGEDI